MHRDLKPGNVMVTAAGAVKVLDFGLAKLADARSDDLMQAPTETAATETGAVLGTPAYMSPEQARGQAVDKRTDIWAFGCVLFELLARRRAFEGATVSDTLAAILYREPDWTALPAATPLRVREVLRRCLTKDVTRRARDIGDVPLDLDTAIGGDHAGTVTHGPRPAGIAWRVAAVASTLVACGTGFLLWQTRASSAPGNLQSAGMWCGRPTVAVSCSSAGNPGRMRAVTWTGGGSRSRAEPPFAPGSLPASPPKALPDPMRLECGKQHLAIGGAIAPERPDALFPGRDRRRECL